MKNRKLLIFLCITFPILLHSQDDFTDQFSSLEEAQIHRNYFFDYANDVLGLKDNIAAYCYEFQINITKKNEFDQLGENIFPNIIRRSIGKDNYIKATVSAPVIVEGVIIKKSYITKPESEFHTEFLVKVNETIFNENGKQLDSLIIKQYTGFDHKGTYVTHSDEIDYYIGEKVILFLQPLSYSKFIGRLLEKSSVEETNKYLESHFNTTLTTLSNNFLGVCKLSEKSNYIFNGKTKIGRKDEVNSLITRLVEINSRADFFKIHKNH